MTEKKIKVARTIVKSKKCLVWKHLLPAAFAPIFLIWVILNEFSVTLRNGYRAFSENFENFWDSVYFL